MTEREEQLQPCDATFGFKVCVLPAGHKGMHESKSKSVWGIPDRKEQLQEPHGHNVHCFREGWEAGLHVRPITLRAARQFVSQHHRHNGAPRGWLFGVGAYVGEVLVGVGIASRPVARGSDDGTTVEIIRCCTDDTRNACSKLYGALTKAAAALGYRRAITYTLATEPGTSLKASGWTRDAELPARGYGGGRARYEQNLLGESVRPEEAKVRWAKRLTKKAAPPSAMPGCSEEGATRGESTEGEAPV